MARLVFPHVKQEGEKNPLLVKSGVSEGEGLKRSERAYNKSPHHGLAEKTACSEGLSQKKVVKRGRESFLLPGCTKSSFARLV